MYFEFLKFGGKELQYARNGRVMEFVGLWKLGLVKQVAQEPTPGNLIAQVRKQGKALDGTIRCVPPA